MGVNAPSMNAPTDISWRGFAITRGLLKRGFIPLFNPWTGAITLYRITGGARMTERELADVWLERVAIGEYLKGIA